MGHCDNPGHLRWWNMKDRLRRLAIELAKLPDEELIPVVQQALRDRLPFPGESGTDHYFIGLASEVEPDDDTEQSKLWKISAIAEPDMEHYSEGPSPTDLFVGPDWGCCQAGICKACGLDACSNMKHGICSVCSTTVYLT